MHISPERICTQWQRRVRAGPCCQKFACLLYYCAATYHTQAMYLTYLPLLDFCLAGCKSVLLGQILDDVTCTLFTRRARQGPAADRSAAPPCWLWHCAAAPTRVHAFACQNACASTPRVVSQCNTASELTPVAACADLIDCSSSSNQQSVQSTMKMADQTVQSRLAACFFASQAAFRTVMPAVGCNIRWELGCSLVC